MVFLTSLLYGCCYVSICLILVYIQALFVLELPLFCWECYNSYRLAFCTHYHSSH